ncbi:hypothetical protein [Streptomyces longwoodensis]|uniref:hypothetical protein n=1 Tax=Streptomyces longwoodensis TaxID=68231 RepID=UPI0033E50DFF
MFDPCPGNCTDPLDEVEELFDELWSMEYRITGDKPKAMKFAREFLDKHAHLLAERIRVELAETVKESLAGGIWQIRTVSTAQQAADLIDPEALS